MIPRFTVAPMNTSTPFGPLVALGFFIREHDIREHDLWAPIRQRVHFTQPTHTVHPVEALLDLGVGILAGCEVVAQVNTTIRPDPLLAKRGGDQGSPSNRPLPASWMPARQSR